MLSEQNRRRSGGVNGLPSCGPRGQTQHDAIGQNFLSRRLRVKQTFTTLDTELCFQPVEHALLGRSGVL